MANKVVHEVEGGISPGSALLVSGIYIATLIFCAGTEIAAGRWILAVALGVLALPGFLLIYLSFALFSGIKAVQADLQRLKKLGINPWA